MPGALAVHSEAVQLPGKPDGEVGDVDGLLNFTLPFGANLPDFQRHQRTEVFLAGAQRFPHLAHDFASFGGGFHPPAVEGAGGFAHDRFVVFGGGEINHAEDRIVTRVSTLDPTGIASRERGTCKGPGVDVSESEAVEEVAHVDSALAHAVPVCQRRTVSRGPARGRPSGYAKAWSSSLYARLPSPRMSFPSSM